MPGSHPHQSLCPLSPHPGNKDCQFHLSDISSVTPWPLHPTPAATVQILYHFPSGWRQSGILSASSVSFYHKSTLFTASRGLFLKHKYVHITPRTLGTVHRPRKMWPWPMSPALSPVLSLSHQIHCHWPHSIPLAPSCASFPPRPVHVCPPGQASPLALDRQLLYACHPLACQCVKGKNQGLFISILSVSAGRQTEALKKRWRLKGKTDRLTHSSLWKRSAKGRDSHLGSQLLLSVHQAFNVCWVIATALTGCDGTFKGGSGDLRGDAGGGAEGPTAEAGGQWVAQGFGDAVTKSLTQQQKVAGFLHLRRSTLLPQQLQSALQF